jgi:hypothetical protein
MALDGEVASSMAVARRNFCIRSIGLVESSREEPLGGPPEPPS